MKQFGFVAAFAVLAMGGTAFAADLPAQRGVISEPTPSGWQGAYIGAHIGYGPGTLTDLGLFGTELAEELGLGPTDFSGIFAGGQIGYNFVIDDKFVVGVEGDASWTNESGSQTISGPVGSPATSFTSNTKLNWTGNLTAHAGYDFGSIMPYVLAGVAFANNTYGLSETGTLLPDGFDVSASATHVGYTIGAGVGALFTDHLSGFVEARYSDYGISNYSFSSPLGGSGPTSISEAVSLKDATVRTGLNWHF